MTARKMTSRTSASARSKKSTVKRPTTKKTGKSTSKSSSKSAKTNISRNPIRNAWTKSEILTNISDNTGLTRKDVSGVFIELEAIIGQHLKGAGIFTLPGVMKITTKRKPATKARKGVNPFTGEPTMFKAKPARTVVKIRPLKKLKEVVV